MPPPERERRRTPARSTCVGSAASPASCSPPVPAPHQVRRRSCRGSCSASADSWISRAAAGTVALGRRRRVGRRTDAERLTRVAAAHPTRLGGRRGGGWDGRGGRGGPVRGREVRCGGGGQAAVGALAPQVLELRELL